MIEEKYIIENRKLWNARVSTHMRSDFYGMQDFLSGKSSLKEIELGLLADVHEKSILHLQCHFGQDSLSLARLGAQVTGVDFSDTAIEQAQVLNKRLGLNAEFVCCDIYILKEYLDGKFDRVFASYGVIGWLPDLDRWAEIIAHFLKPGGEFIFVEFHPVVWMYNTDFNEIKYSYFNVAPIIEEISGTYTDHDEEPVKSIEYGWNHSLSEVMTALLSQKLIIADFKEYDFSPYACFDHLSAEGKDRYFISHLGKKMPLTYGLRVIKPL